MWILELDIFKGFSFEQIKSALRDGSILAKINAEQCDGDEAYEYILRCEKLALAQSEN